MISLLPPPNHFSREALLLGLGGRTRYVGTPSPSPAQKQVHSLLHISHGVWLCCFLVQSVLGSSMWKQPFSFPSFSCAKHLIQWTLESTSCLTVSHSRPPAAHKGRGQQFQLSLRNFWECYIVGGTHVGRVTCALTEVEG